MYSVHVCVCTVCIAYDTYAGLPRVVSRVDESYSNGVMGDIYYDNNLIPRVVSVECGRQTNMGLYGYIFVITPVTYNVRRTSRYIHSHTKTYSHIDI